MAGGVQKKKRAGGKSAAVTKLKKPDSRAKKIVKKKISPMNGY